MKRRIQDTHPENPSPIRISFPEALDRGRSHVTQRDPQSNRDDGPKTSEYAFFKKLKKDAGQRFDSHSMQREKNQPNKLNSSECRGVEEGTKIVRNISKSSEVTNITRNCYKEFRSPLSVANISSKELGSLLSIKIVGSKDSRSPLPINNVTRINFDSFLPPVDGAANNSEVNLKNAFSTFESICSIEDWLEHDSNNKRLGGSQSDQVDLFSRKRQKLRQWAHNSFPEIEELFSKGYDLISMLLSRLLPWSNEKNTCGSAESAPMESNTNAELLACPKSDIPSEKLYRLPKRNNMEVEYMPYLENGTSCYWSDRSRETMLSNICSPTYKNHSTLQKNLELPSCELRRKNLISCIEGESTFGFPLVRHGSFPPFSSFKEPDDLHDSNGSLPGREPHLLLLEWDSVNINERSLSATCQNTNWTIIPAVRSSWDHKQILNNWCELSDIHELCSSPVQGNYPQDFCTLLPPNSTSYGKHDFGRSILEEEEETVAELNHLPLTLSHSSKGLNLIADCDLYGIACKGSETNDILRSPGNHFGFMSRALGEENSTPGFGTHLSFALDVEWKCLQSSDLRRERCLSTYNDLQFLEKEIIYSNFLSEDEFESSSVGSSCRSLMSSEDMVDIHDWQSFYFQISRNKDKAYPLLLDKSSWEDCTEETYDSDNQFKCI
ncbi:uncharacterized protein LOC111283972 [Durio zibethinus]|uniref:Uncharacterized protein LOC111283972 n=1 Tax=Durio zibethinus TaxID=66656 RepID=A0A6P5XJN2_DURZI|nr:uncharacterized protein LOC111283972 [Durio zibethinus]